MVVKSKNKKIVKKEKVKKVVEQEEEKEGGLDLDDAFGDDEDVEYAKPKPAKIKKKGYSEDEVEEMVDEAVDAVEKINGSGDEPVKREITFKTSKPISKPLFLMIISLSLHLSFVIHCTKIFELWALKEFSGLKT